MKSQTAANEKANLKSARLYSQGISKTVKVLLPRTGNNFNPGTRGSNQRLAIRRGG